MSRCRAEWSGDAPFQDGVVLGVAGVQTAGNVPVLGAFQKPAQRLHTLGLAGLGVCEEDVGQFLTGGHSGAGSISGGQDSASSLSKRRGAFGTRSARRSGQLRWARELGGRRGEECVGVATITVCGIHRRNDLLGVPSSGDRFDKVLEIAA